MPKNEEALVLLMNELKKNPSPDIKDTSDKSDLIQKNYMLRYINIFDPKYLNPSASTDIEAARFHF